MSNINSLAVVVLAAGEGKRLKYPDGKPMIPFVGKRLIDFPMSASLDFLRGVNKKQISFVVGHQKEKLIQYIKKEYSDLLRLGEESITFADQKSPLGTGDAVKSYFRDTPNAHEFEYTMVMCGDTPLIRSADLRQLSQAALANTSHGGPIDIGLATFETSNPYGYGRIIKRGDETRIIEEKDASAEEKKVNEVNSGLYIFRTAFLASAINKIESNNSSNEFYLTDLLKFTKNVKIEKFIDGITFMGINERSQHEFLQKIVYQEKAKELQSQGVFFIDTSAVYIDWDVVIGEGTTIYPQVVIQGKSKIGSYSTIENGSIIKNSQLADNVQVNGYSYIEGSIIKNSALIGPFARLRSESMIGEDCKIGNFVETKKVDLKNGVKVSHLSYIGDAEIGAESNIGCGFITCNYDGEKKHKTKIGQGTFIGSDCQAIAPIEIGSHSFVAAGTTITENLPMGAFAISRVKQVTKEGMAKRFLKTKTIKL